jgi:lipid A 3-O-deacylase
MKPCSIAIAVVLAVVVAASQAHAQEAADSQPRQPWLSEIRVGVLAHDQAPLVNNIEAGTDLNLEVLFPSPRILHGIGSPRPHIGVTIASEGTSLAYAGLTWEYNFRSGWFLVGGAGLAAHDGDPLQEEEQTQREAETEKALGCRVVAHFGVGAGYRISSRWNVAIHYEHLSNATLCGSNEGLENIGVRVGRVF